jgi:rhodanese-related sulfurtransferase
MKPFYKSIFLLLTIFAFAACSGQKSAIDVEHAFLVDVRTPGEFAEGSVPGAVNIPVDEISQRLEEFKGKEQVVVFCRSGSRSSRAEGILTNNGIENVVNGGTWQMVDELVKSKK